MNLSKTKISVFFLTVILLTWFLYPRELFLGFIYEGSEDLKKSERNYVNYLKDNPRNKFVTIRLAKLYERLSEPQKAIKIIQDLYSYRKKDWELATFYLELLENNNEEQQLLETRLLVVENFKENFNFPKERLESLLALALEQSLWLQNYELSHQILLDLIELSPEPEPYLQKIYKLSQGLKNSGRLLKILKTRLAENPENTQIKKEIISIYIALGEFKQAQKLLDQLVKDSPNNKEYRKLRLSFFERTGDHQATLQEAKILMGFKELTPDEHKSYLEKIAYIQYQHAEYQNSLESYRQLIAKDPYQKLYWQIAIDILDKLGNTEQLISTIEEFLVLFPEDTDQKKSLAHAVLYKQKSFAELESFRVYLKEVKDQDFALDVIYLMMESQAYGAAQSWLKEVSSWLHNTTKTLSLKLDLYTKVHRHQEALGLAQTLHQREPNLDNTLLLANLYATQGFDALAAKTLNEHAHQHTDSAQTLTTIGRELFYLGEYRSAQVWLLESLNTDPLLAHTWFWLMETYSAEGQKNKKRHCAQKVLDLLDHKSTTQNPVFKKRMQLRAKAHLRWTHDVSKNYQVTLNQNPKAQNIHLDYIDALLTNKKASQAQEQIALFEKQFPQLDRLVAYQHLRLSELKKDWPQTVYWSQRILNFSPHDLSVRYSMVQAYEKMGLYRQAVSTVDQTKLSQAASVKEEKNWKLFSHKIHETYDDQVGIKTQFQDFGSGTIWEWQTQSQTRIKKDFKLITNMQLGRYHLDSASNQKLAGKAWLSLATDALRPVKIIAGVGGHGSSNKTAAFGHASISYKPNPEFSASTAVHFYDQRHDLPQAINAGAVENKWVSQGQIALTKNLTLNSTYELNQTKLSSGLSAWGHEWESNLNFALLKEPFISVGYQFALNDQTTNAAFLGELPLISSSHTHSINLFGSYAFTPELLIEASVFFGEDTKRDLSLFQGDLWGTSIRFKWRITRHFFIDSNYQYGRETQSSTAGSYHQAFLKITGHWWPTKSSPND